MDIRSCEKCGAISDINVLKEITKRKIENGDIFTQNIGNGKDYKDETKDKEGKNMPFTDYYDFSHFVCPVCGETTQIYS